MPIYNDSLKFPEGVCYECRQSVPLIYADKIPVPLGERWWKQSFLSRTEAPLEAGNYMCVTHAFNGKYCNGSGIEPETLSKDTIVTAEHIFLSQPNAANETDRVVEDP